jgi:putative transcriptional regulator
MITHIKKFRTRKGITQDELAKKVGVRRETIVFLEKGRYNPSLGLAYSIAKELGAGIDELFVFENIKIGQGEGKEDGEGGERRKAGREEEGKFVDLKDFHKHF